MREVAEMWGKSEAERGAAVKRKMENFVHAAFVKSQVQ